MSYFTNENGDNFNHFLTQQFQNVQFWSNLHFKIYTNHLNRLSLGYFFMAIYAFKVLLAILNDFKPNLI